MSTRHDKREEGAAAIEFALVALLFLTLLLGIVAFAVQFGARIAATQAASEGARASVAGLDVAERQTLATAAARAVIQRYGSFIPISTATVIAAPDSTDATRFEVTVRVDVSRFGLERFASFLPTLPNQPEARVGVRVGGF